MSFPGTNQPQQQYGPPPGGFPQPPSPAKRSGLLLAGLIAVTLVVVLLVVVVLSRAGVIDEGPFAKKVAKVPPITQFPTSAGGLFRVHPGSQNEFPVLFGSKYEWNRYALYATVAQHDRNPTTDYAEYMVNAYGSLDDVEDVFSDPKQKTEVGSALCATEIVGQGLMRRLCGVNRGSIVVTVQGRWSGHDDQKLAGYANAIADGIS
jgi:hypothetical protein